MRSCRGERVKESGRMPAMKDLALSDVARYGVSLSTRRCLRNCHDGAQSEQHEKTVPHVACRVRLSAEVTEEGRIRLVCKWKSLKQCVTRCCPCL